jgi:Ser-tRNA(Ala) deacylase AlaX
MFIYHTFQHLTLQICESKITAATKDEEINDLKRKISAHVEQEARLGAQITTLRERVLELVCFCCVHEMPRKWAGWENCPFVGGYCL